MRTAAGAPPADANRRGTGSHAGVSPWHGRRLRCGCRLRKGVHVCASVSLCPRIVALAVGFAIASLAGPAEGGLVFSVSGSAAGSPVSFVATMTIAGGTLTIQLDNTSPVDTSAAAQVLTSFYFDILSGTSRPSLNFTGGSGFLYLVRSGTADLPYFYTPQTFTQVGGIASDLRAVNNGDQSWQLRAMAAASPPNLGFGIGTVANATFTPNGFTPAIVGQGSTMINFGIYRGADIEPTGVLDGRYLVRDSATFTFTGVDGYSEANIVDKVVFGLGTMPDATFTVSLAEPETWALVAPAVVAITVGVTARRRRRRVVDGGEGWYRRSCLRTSSAGEP